MGVAMLLVLIATLASVAVTVPATLRLKDGTVYQLREPPYLKNGRFQFTTLRGNFYSISEKEVADIHLLAPSPTPTPAPNPQDSRQLGAIARKERKRTGKHAAVAPAPTPLPEKEPAR
jgi:hypothetical protein